MVSHDCLRRFPGVRPWICLTVTFFLVLKWGPAQTSGQEPSAKDDPSTREDRLPRGAVARIGSISFSHVDTVAAVAFSPDGKTILTGSLDKTAVLWEASTGKRLRRLTEVGGPVYGVAFSRNARWIATASHKGGVRIWNAADGTLFSAPETEGKDAWSVAFSPDSRSVAYAMGTDVAVWDLEARKLQHRLKGNGQDPVCVTFSAQGGTVAAGTLLGGRILTWDLASEKRILDVDSGGVIVRSVAFSPDGKSIGAALLQEGAGLWDAATGKAICSLAGDFSAVYTVGFTSDGKSLVAGCDNGVGIWSLPGGNLKWKENVDGRSVWSVAASPDGKRFALGGSILLRFVDAGTGKEIQGPDRPGEVLCAIKDGNRLATGGMDQVKHARRLRIWESDSGKQVSEHSFAGDTSLLRLGVQEDGNPIAILSVKDGLELWDVRRDKLLTRMTGHQGYVWAAAYSAGGRRIASVSGDRSVMLWDADSGKNLLRLQGHQEMVTCVAISEKGQRIFSGSFDGTMRIWDANTGQQLGMLRSGDELLRFQIDDVACAPGGERVVASSFDTVFVYDLAQARVIRTIRAPDSMIKKVALSPDGSRLITGDSKGTIRVWQLDNGKELQSFSGHEGGITGLVVLTDGKRFASSSDDGTVLIWKLD